MKTVDSMMRKAMQTSVNEMEKVGVTAQNSFETNIDYNRIEKMQSRGIYIDGRLIGRTMKDMGVVFT